jgi:rhodanese-related sulfurtransferase
MKGSLLALCYQTWQMKTSRLIFFLVLVTGIAAFSFTSVQTEWVCTPCGADCDKEVHSKGGVCEVCNMALVEKQTVKFKSISPKQACDFLNDTSVVVLDVRTPGEYSGTSGTNYGHLKGAINIPIQELEKRIGELDKVKDKQILVYCSHSRRSPRASYMLNTHGFNNVTNMSGGMSEWDPACTKWLVK